MKVGMFLLKMTEKQQFDDDGENGRIPDHPAWDQLEASKRLEKQTIAAFDAGRGAVAAWGELQRSAVGAWLDLVAPAPAEA